MTTTTYFDTLRFVERLVGAGMPREQAMVLSDANLEVISEAMKTGLVTREDFYELEKRLDRLENKLDSRMDKLDGRIDALDAKLETLSLKLTIRLGGMLVVGIGVISALMKIL